MLNQLLERLACLEQLEPTSIRDAEAIFILETVATMPEGLQVLVEKYSGSQLPILGRSLSFILAVKSSSSDSEIAPLLFKFIEKTHVQDELTIINCLTAIQRQIIVKAPKITLEQPPNFLCNFLMSCLNQPVAVQRAALSAIGRIYESDLILEVFEGPQLVSLREQLTKLSNLGEPLLDREIKRLTHQGEILPIPRTSLIGSDLLEKVKEFSHLSSRTLAKQCGYYTLNKNNHYRANLSEFYREMRKAKRLYPEFEVAQNGHKLEPNGQDSGQ